MPTQWDANLSLAYPISIGPATVTLQAYLFSAFNRQTPTSIDEVYTTDDSATVNPNYGLATGRMPPRSFRGAIRVAF
jgi:hypothetical protein